MTDQHEPGSPVWKEGLPFDSYGVQVDNERDRLTLQWLVQAIGEAKLRRSVEKHSRRYPDRRPFVSLLLRWYNLKVPVAVYAPVAVPIFSVYLLVLADGSAVKIGSTGDVARRVRGMLPAQDLARVSQIFDLDLSLSYSTANKRRALDDERTALLASVDAQCAAPTAGDGRIGVPWGAGGRTEWRDGAARQRIEATLLRLAAGSPLVSLRTTLQRAHQVANPDFLNASLQ